MSILLVAGRVGWPGLQSSLIFPLPIVVPDIAAEIGSASVNLGQGFGVGIFATQLGIRCYSLADTLTDTHFFNDESFLRDCFSVDSACQTVLLIL